MAPSCDIARLQVDPSKPAAAEGRLRLKIWRSAAAAAVDRVAAAPPRVFSSAPVPAMPASRIRACRKYQQRNCRSCWSVFEAVLESSVSEPCYKASRSMRPWTRSAAYFEDDTIYFADVRATRTLQRPQ